MGFGMCSKRLSRPAAAPSASAAAQRGRRGSRLFKYIRVVLGNLVVWTAVYLWFFKSVHIIDAASESHPRVQSTVYVLLALLPIGLVKTRLASGSLRESVKGLAALVRPLVIRHVLRTAAGPMGAAANYVLMFTATNLLVQALPDKFAVQTPHHMRFLDPDGDGMVTEAEIVSGIATISVKLLRAALASCLCAWFLAAKRPPEEYEKHEGRTILYGFWNALVDKRGFAVIIDLSLSLVALGCTALIWFKFLGFSPQTVLTFSGVGGIAFGFASQNLIGNLVGGLLILVTRPFKEGDFIESSEVSGHVKRVGWNFTEVQTLPGPVVYLPNSGLLQTTTQNRTASGRRRVRIEVPVRFPTGEFHRCPLILKGIEKHVAEACGSQHDIVDGPAAYLKGMEPIDYSSDPLAVILVDTYLNNAGLGELNLAKSDVNIATMNYLKEEGCDVIGLEQ